MSATHAGGQKNSRAPSWMRAIIRLCMPLDDRDAMVHEMDGLYANRVVNGTRVTANLWYLRQMFGFLMRLGPLSAIRVLGSWDSLSGDLQVALRYFKRKPGYVVTFGATLGIGAGVLSTVYTAANWVLLRPVPGVHDADQLTVLRLGALQAPPQVSFHVSHPDLLTLRERLQAISEIAATSAVDVDVRVGNGEAVRLAGDVVTSNYFRVLHATPAFGRAFSDDEERSVADINVVVVSYDVAKRWTRDVSTLVGSDIRINGSRFQVVGVAESGFRGAELPGRADLWFPLSALAALDPSSAHDAASNRGTGVWQRMVVRLHAGATSEALAKAANGVMNEVRADFKGKPHSYMANIHTFQAFVGIGLDPSVRATVRHTLWLVSIASAFLMLLAMANLANLVLSQASTREGATAVRVALGAGRARIARSQIVESVLLGLLGGVVGVALSALWGRWFEGATLSEYGGSLRGMRMDIRVVGATMAVAIVAAILSSARQAFATRTSTLDRLLRVTSSRTPGRMHMQMSLVATQVALSLMLVVAAGLLSRTVGNLRKIDLGFAPDRLLTFAVDPLAHGYQGARLEQLGTQFEEQIVREHDVVAAGLIAPSPLNSGYITGSLYGSEAPDAQPVVGAGFFVTPGFLKALHVKTLAGETEWRGDSGTVVITLSMAAKLYPGVRADLLVGRMPPSRSRGRVRLRIAAVIQNVQLSDITGAPIPTYFRPLREGLPGLTVSGFVLTGRSAAGAAPAVRRAMQAIAPDVPPYAMQSARAAVDLQFAERNVMAVVASTLGILGLTLAAIGLYGVLSSLVAARQREIGIRVALGATPREVRRRVMLGGLRPALFGMAVGLGGALVTSKLLASLLYGIKSLDPQTYVSGVLALLIVTVLTCLPPAIRATRVAPATVLTSN